MFEFYLPHLLKAKGYICAFIYRIIYLFFKIEKRIRHTTLANTKCSNLKLVWFYQKVYKRNLNTFLCKFNLRLFKHLQQNYFLIWIMVYEIKTSSINIYVNFLKNMLQFSLAKPQWQKESTSKEFIVELYWYKTKVYIIKQFYKFFDLKLVTSFKKHKTI